MSQVPQAPAFYVARDSYDAKGNGEMNVKRGDMMHIISSSGNWWRVKLLETGEEGKIPREIVVEPKSLYTER